MHLLEDDLVLYIREQLPPDHVMMFGEHLAECAECSHKLERTRSVLRRIPDQRVWNPGRADRRQEPRTPLNTGAMLRIVNPFSAERWKIQVLDASENGVRFAVPVFLEPRMIVQIQLTDAVLFAEVRYCRAAGSVFHAGVQVQERHQTSRSA